jgi:hypothetical protein
MTKEQKALLKCAVRWYVDGTFKIISKPFTQLFSIHGFIRKDDNVKQVPLCFVFMSGRTERDYRKVFQKIIEIIGGEADCCIEELVTDFERAIWRGARNAFTEKNIEIFGCAFHWCQAVYRNLKISESQNFAKLYSRFGRLSFRQIPIRQMNFLPNRPTLFICIFADLDLGSFFDNP